MLYVRMTDALMRRLKSYADQRDLTISAAARMLIKQMLDREDSDAQAPPT